MFVLKILISLNVRIDGNGVADGLKQRLHSFVKKLDPSKIVSTAALLSIAGSVRCDEKTPREHDLFEDESHHFGMASKVLTIAVAAQGCVSAVNV